MGDNMTKERNDKVEAIGTIVEVLPSTMFRVKIDGTDHIVLAHLSGKMRLNFIKLVVGDKVKLEMSPYDLTKARIVYRIDPKKEKKS
jgi:translation initiation factor IF-1